MQTRNCSRMLLLLVGATPVLGQVPPKPAPSKGTVQITAALVDQAMQVHPVPLYAIILTSTHSDTFTTRTTVDGTASIQVPPGAYTVSGVAPALFQGTRYRWNIHVSVEAGKTVETTLANDNATSEAAPGSGPPLSVERVDAAATLFNRLQHSVFRIQAGLAHGSGFLADTLGGVILTNAHVVEFAEQEMVSVVLDSVTRVRANLLARDADADIAVLRINPDLVRGRVLLPLQNPQGKAPVAPGDRLVAMGFPLYQELTITAGIASSVRAGAIISDVNINHGNSGGPLLNLDGEVVAINTFADLPDQGGPGVSGSILIARAGPALATAKSALDQAVPSASHLPVMPLDRFEMASLRASVDSADPSWYHQYYQHSVGGFDLTLQTPLSTFVAVKAYEDDIAQDRKKREALAGLPESQKFSQLREYRDWAQYVGDRTAPVVSIAVVPKVGETSGSVFGRLMLGPNLKATFKFKGDVRGVEVFRNQEPVEPIKGGHAPVQVYIDDQWKSLKDVADQGFYLFDPEIAKPDSSGAPPSIVVAVRDLKHPDKLKCLEIDPYVVAQVWNDFEIFYAEKRPTAGFRTANSDRAKGRKPLWKTDFLKDDCDWEF